MYPRASLKPREKTFQSWYPSQTGLGEEGRPRSKWNFPFCYFFTNQAGTVIMSFVGLALMMVTLLFNLYAINNAPTCTKIVQYILLFLYLAIMISGFLAALAGAYNEIGTISQLAAFIVAVGTVIFLVFYFISLSTRTIHMVYVCPEMRCPDHHWLQDSWWRGRLDYSGNRKTGNATAQNVSQPRDGDVALDNGSCDIHIVSKHHKWYYVMASVFFMLMITAFFLYSIITFYAYGSYLKSSGH